MKTVAFLLANLLLAAPVAASCPRFTTGSTSCSSGIFTDSDLSASCSDDDVISISGTVTAVEFDGTENVKLVPCFMGYCFTQYTQDAGEICNLIENADGNDCGAAGTYTVDEEFAIPDSAQRASAVMGAVKIKVFVNDEEACSQLATANASYNMMVGCASLFLVAGVGVVMRRRRRRRPLIVLDGASDNFVEMRENPSAGAMV
jgi:hypothetical protein